MDEDMNSQAPSHHSIISRRHDNQEEEVHSHGSITIKKKIGESTHRAGHLSKREHNVDREQLELVIDENTIAYDSAHDASSKQDKKNNYNLSL